MLRACGAIAIAMLMAAHASAQTGDRIPDGPPASPSLVSVSPGADAPGFVHVTFAEREMKNGVVVGRFWLINIFKTPQEAAAGLADASWSLYQAECSGTAINRIVSFWIDKTGRIVATVPPPAGRVLKREPDSPFDIGAKLSCDNIVPVGQRYTTLAEALQAVRGK